MQTIKSLARGPWAAGAQHARNTWYEPLSDPDDVRLAVRWTLGRPEIFLVSTGDVDLLPLVLAAAEGPAEPPPSDEAMKDLAERQGLTSIFGL